MKMVVTINPATGEEIKKYEFKSGDWLERAVERAANAQKDWQHRTFTERVGAVQRFERSLREEREGLARMMSLEMGKPLKQSFAEIDKSIHSCQVLRELYPQWMNDHQYSSPLGHSVHLVPLGVILGIMPWNFPLWQVVRFAIPTLLGGNSVLLKHAPNTWGSAEKIEEIFASAFPENVFINLQIDVPMIERLIADPRIRGASLTGSRRAGSSVAELCGRFLKKCVLELGGSDAYVIFEDADLDHAVEVCAASRLQNAGQSCVAAKRFIVHKSLLENFTDKMIAEMAKRKMGDPMDLETDLGPLARADLRQTLREQVESALQSGARLMSGGKIPEGPGYYYPPTVLVNVNPGQAAFDEELFGPVAAIIEAPNNREALRLANLSRYGLGGAIFSRDVERAKDLAINEFEAGMVFINDYVRSDAMVPFGGIKDSGIGRELGREGCFEFMNIKLIGG